MSNLSPNDKEIRLVWFRHINARQTFGPPDLHHRARHQHVPRGYLLGITQADAHLSSNNQQEIPR